MGIAGRSLDADLLITKNQPALNAVLTEKKCEQLD